MATDPPANDQESGHRDEDLVVLPAADYLRLIIHGVTAFELLRTALELELFEQLETADGMTVEELAAALGVDEQPARILLLGLSCLSLLRKQGPKYHNSPIARRKLLRAAPRYLGPLVDVQAEVINPTLSDLAESVRQHTNVGLRHLPGPGDTLYERLTAHPTLQRTFYRNMGDASEKAFAQLLERYDFSDARRVLDLGGGDGTNAMALAQRHPHLDVTVFDQESVVSLAEQRTRQLPADIQGRLRFRAGDLFADPLPEGADTIVVFHIFEIWSLARNTELLRKCHAVLPDGGVCLVYSFVSHDEGTGSMSAGLVSPYFLTLASGEGMTYAPGDMAEAARSAGFGQVQRFDGLGFSHALVVARK